MEFLEFTFRSGWHFAGVFVLIWLVLQGIAIIVAAIRS